MTERCGLCGYCGANLHRDLNTGAYRCMDCLRAASRPEAELSLKGRTVVWPEGVPLTDDEKRGS
jgi:hypothetical protein